jgi:hypothetical protein
MAYLPCLYSFTHICDKLSDARYPSRQGQLNDPQGSGTRPLACGSTETDVT